MCFRNGKAAVLAVLVLAACTPLGKIQKIRTGQAAMSLSVPSDDVPQQREEAVVIDSIRNSLSEGPIIMNAIRDSETGEMVATDVIRASKVTARFRHVAERGGRVTIGFDVRVPSAMSDSYWQLKISPRMRIQEDTLDLDDIFITGSKYRQMQMKGYQRYRAFLASIITDTTDLVRVGQLEIFLQRYFPDTYAMKTDSSLVSEPAAENLFGVTQREALKHYTRQGALRRNEWKKRNKDRMFRKYVKDPILDEGVRLDTVIASGGAFLYRYTHTFASRPGLKKVMVSLQGRLFERGECLMSLPYPDELTFYISSLSSLAEQKTKYIFKILERRVYDNTKALIDFRQGRSSIDTTLRDNASELRRVVRCIDDVLRREEFGLDSLVIVASCSPEGSFEHNRRLSIARSDAVRKYIRSYVPAEWKEKLRVASVPENWHQFKLLAENDSLIGPEALKRIEAAIGSLDNPDASEKRLSALPEYRYLREKIYPQLRSVSFDFYLHRVGMVKDTVHTSEIDTVYMEGLKALKELDYKKAVKMLRPYDDYNSALAFVSAGYNHSALDVLGRLSDEDAHVCYLKALVLSRLGQQEEALKYFDLSLAYDPYMRHRANLDPEMSELVSKRKNEYDE